MFRVGIAGLGMLGTVHLKNFLQFEDAQVVALADVEEDRRSGRIGEVAGNLEETGGALDIGEVDSYSDYGDLCDADNVDVVVVALPDDLHLDAAERALKSGKHVLCEKPITRTSEQGRLMLQAAEASGKTLMIGHCLRFWPEYLEAERIIKSGDYGRVLAASFVRCTGFPTWSWHNWYADADRSGGAAHNLHVHDADVAVWWWRRPAAISAGGVMRERRPDVVHSHWKYENGLSVQFESTFEPSPKAPFFYNFKITMEKGTLLFDSRNDAGLVLGAIEGEHKIPFGTESAYLSEGRYFLNCLNQGKKPELCPPEESLVTLECVEEEVRQIAAT